jgi:hypothetical protein
MNTHHDKETTTDLERREQLEAGESRRRHEWTSDKERKGWYDDDHSKMYENNMSGTYVKCNPT